MRRTLVNTLERRKEMMIAALWSNSAFDKTKKGTEQRQTAIEECEEQCSVVVNRILSGLPITEEEDEIDKSNPFFGGMERGLKKIDTPRHEEGTVAAAIASGAIVPDIDQ